MKRFWMVAALAVCLVCSWTQAQAPELKKLEDTVEGRLMSGQTTVDDQTDVAVTVYNNNRALVRDRRSIKMLPGEAPLRFMDVASAILPETVSLRSINDPGALKILEQNYEFDLMSPEKLMEKYVGREVTLVNKSSDYTFYEQAATLLSVNNGPIYQVEGKIYLGHPGQVVLPKIPDELIAKPTLVWLLSNDGTDHEVEATYLTEGMNWRADYVLTLNREETALDIEGWVTLTNQSGAPYNNAQLKLVAGDVNIVFREQVSNENIRADFMPVMAPAPMMQEESFAEYHLYTLERRTTIKENQTKQVSLLNGSNVAVEKHYEFRGDVNFYSGPIQAIRDQNADVFVTFQNREENGLGMPLPGGVMRVYQADQSGMLQFSGEDRIRHTPKNEEVRLTLGKAFDVVGDRTQDDYKALGPNMHESAFTISVRNRKDTAIKVDVVEPISGDWSIVDESAPHAKKDAQTAIFTLDVPADSEAKVSYRVRVRY